MADSSTFIKAQRHLARRDPVLRQVIRSVGPCTLRFLPERFTALVHSIISQQISTKAAASIRSRLAEVLAPGGITLSGIAQASDTSLRSAGLSSAKVRAVRDLAEKVAAGLVPLEGIHEFPDEEVISLLVPVRGIGPWTAQMFLIFCLGRLDVLPVADLGLRAAVKHQYGLAELPAREKLEELGERWRPFRSIATWYFWRSLGFVPQSEKAPTKAK